MNYQIFIIDGDQPHAFLGARKLSFEIFEFGLQLKVFRC